MKITQKKNYILIGNSDENMIYRKKCPRVLRCITEDDKNELLKRMKMPDCKLITYERRKSSINNCDWTNLPLFKYKDPHPQVKINFSTYEDEEEFYKKILKQKWTKCTKRGIWFPEKERIVAKNQGFWESDENIHNKYPIFVISKGRHETRLTSDWLNNNKIKHYLIVEDSEYDIYDENVKNLDYVELIGFDRDENTEEGDGGGIPARNFVDYYAREEEHAEKYWLLDDNIRNFVRSHNNARIEFKNTSVFFRILEDYADRYNNLYFSGMQYKCFSPAIDRTRSIAILNTRIYSCMLISVKLKKILDGVLWRGVYNEDTDLSLRVLKKGLPTILHQNILCDKMQTMKCKGGNTDTIYIKDGLRKKYDSLKSQHPDLVTPKLFKDKPEKIHHQVDYTSFKTNKFKKKKIKKNKITKHNEYGLKIFKNLKKNL